MIDLLSTKEIWFVTGTQSLYGPETLEQVDVHSRQIAESLEADSSIPTRIVFKPCVKSPDEIKAICLEANSAPNCAGLIFWMHTFSPGKMWINGLKQLSKPFCHLHTQFNRDIPWADIDMDFMNLNQSAHGDREFGFICSRLRLNRKVIVGHWEDPDLRAELSSWTRVAAAWAELQQMKVVRFGDNMRYVAVTDGDKVDAESVFGFSVNTHGVGDLVDVIQQQSDADVATLCDEYADSYELATDLTRNGQRHDSLKDTARIELGMRAFLKQGGFTAFTDTFEDLHGMKQLPGLPTQRLMADGYGFGAEGDWKTAALVRAMKIMAAGDDQGTSFMEDYTYHLSPDGMRCLGAHMLEICPSIAAAKPRCEIHPLGIGGKEDPVRLVFDGKPGPALNASLIDMGNRFRLLINEVVAHVPDQALPKLPVARVLWEIKPDFKTGAAAWILAGGAHHTCYSYSVNTEQLVSLAEMAGIESVIINDRTDLHALKNELRWNDASY